MFINFLNLLLIYSVLVLLLFTLHRLYRHLYS